ncbi:MAG: methyl-accepting chemotaxis protein [Treponema sp.]|nr:methyl-accepting chemotaxis protein [Treponema sp.]
MNNKFLIIVSATIVETFGLLFFLLYGMQQIQTMKNFQYMQARMQGHLAECVNYVNNVNNYNVVTSEVSDKWEETVKALSDDIEFLTNSKDLDSLPYEFLEALDYIPDLWRAIKYSLKYISESFEELQAIPVTGYENFYLSTMGIANAKPHLQDSENYEKIYDIWTTISEQTSSFRVSANDMAISNEEAINTLSELCIRKEKNFAVTAMLIALIASVIVVILVLAITGRIVKRIQKVRDITACLMEKDFTVEVHPNGSNEMVDLMKNMNRMVSELNTFLLVVKETAAKAISSGYQISNSADSTASATTEIDANIESITKEFDQISVSVEKSVTIIADMNRQVDNLVHYNSRQSSAVADMNKTVLSVAETLGEITQMAEARARDAQEMHQLVADGDQKIKITAQMLDEIKKQLNEISGVVKIINDIASQTNLLSMNAAIESAHAGEAGKGFSVVAGEIRNLAESTTANAKKIRESVNMIVDTVGNANIASVQASEAFGKVRINADQVIDSMQEISHGIIHVDDQMKSIREKTEETAVAADEISSFCEKLADKQRNVSEEVSSIDSLFSEAQRGIHEIKNGTSDIVSRVSEVNENSKDSYKNMTELETVLAEFKTKTLEETEELNVEEGSFESSEEQVKSEDRLENKPEAFRAEPLESDMFISSTSDELDQKNGDAKENVEEIEELSFEDIEEFD